MPEKITAIIIAHQAEATITACVKALGFCDRIIVGEHASPDKTAALAREAGASVVSVTWEGFARTKNKLIDLVADGWILSVDSDEVVTPELAREIQGRVEKAGNRPGEPVAYWISRRNYFLGREIRHCGWRPDWQLRLFRAGRGRFEERPVHEALKVEGDTSRLQQVMDHYSYPSLAAYLSRLNRYTSLAAAERHQRSKRFSGLRLLCDPLWTFIKMYGIKAGWRDGFPGLALCLLSSLNTFVKYAKLWEMEIRKENPEGAAHA